ncbi:ThiF family adenylyltransferase [Sphingobium aromaticiconvertens]|uniref:ThiF family adenylyltransferase n=1 Tax=Sphingobium aromaticiconvertens TaxID=365341 RepID=UPI00301AC063
MPNVAGFGALGFERAIVRLEAALREHLPAPHRRLTTEEVKAAYPSRSFERGWRIDMLCSDDVTRQIDLLVTRAFPAGYPRTALVNPPDMLTWPHVERDGILCLLPVLAEVDAEDPGQVGLNLIGRSARLIEELLVGDIVERDFREEFLTYWFYASDVRTKVTSLIDPVCPSRKIRVWRGEDMVVAGENEAQLNHWLVNRFGKRSGKKTFHTESAAFLWLPQPPLPSDYPQTGADLIALATSAGEVDAAILADVAGAHHKDVLVLIGAEGRGGAGLVAATTTAARKISSRDGHVEKPLTKGFTAAGMPPAIAAARVYSAARVLKSEVSRADAAWVHGRGKDPRTARLLAKQITVIGGGAIGSSVTARLVRAGVGTSHIVDPQDFDWPNIGRHELGASSVGKNKAFELAARFSQDFPHLAITGHNVGAQRLIDGYEDLLANSDLIIATTGSWDAEGALNRWHVVNGRKVPILYGWTEKHAAAGHAVLIEVKGGCLRCGMSPTGTPTFKASLWADGQNTVEEPSCGNHFTPYGAVELGHVVDVIAETALGALLDPPLASRHHIWLTGTARLEAEGAMWTDNVTLLGEDLAVGQKILSRDWPARECPACALAEDALIAAE